MPLAFLCRVAAECSTFRGGETPPSRSESPRSCAGSARHTLKYLEMEAGMSRAGSCGRDDAQREADPPGRRTARSSVERVRTRSRAIPAMIEYFALIYLVEARGGCARPSARRGRGDCRRLRKELPDYDIPVGQIGCVLGTTQAPQAWPGLRQEVAFSLTCGPVRPHPQDRGVGYQTAEACDCKSEGPLLPGPQVSPYWERRIGGNRPAVTTSNGIIAGPASCAAEAAAPASPGRAHAGRSAQPAPIIAFR